MTDKSIHWIDLDGTLWHTDAKWWIIDKNDPSKPVIKISQLEGSLILSGFHKSDDIHVSYNGQEGFLSKDMFIKICRVKKLDPIDIGFSWREFQDKDLIEKQVPDLVLYVDRIKNLSGDERNTINLLTARGNKDAHQPMLDKLHGALSLMNIKINDSYFVSDPSSVSFIGRTDVKKIMCILQNITGFLIKDSGFVPLQAPAYKVTHFYDDEDRNIETALNANFYLKELLTYTPEWLIEDIHRNISNNQPVLYVNKVETNELNPFSTKEVKIVV